MHGLDWSAIRLFSSTGECSSADDMRWLMELAGGKPVIEYCGGTEIGGGYLTGTVTLPCVPGTFNTPALGLDVVILDEDGTARRHRAKCSSCRRRSASPNTLLNQDHHEVYFAGVPRGPRGETLRRHGDQMERLPDGGWRAMGRADDTMNLGGIKVSSAEIEHVLRFGPRRAGTAAIAVSPGGGPSLLVIYAVVRCKRPRTSRTLVGRHAGGDSADLNPLFKIHEVVLIDALPRTASNKVMRRDAARPLSCQTMTRSPKHNILITGAGSGLGRGLGLCLARQGHTILVTDLRPRRGRTKPPPRSKRRAAAPRRTRWTSLPRQTFERFVSQTDREHPIDVLINNAGLQHVARLEEFPARQMGLADERPAARHVSHDARRPARHALAGFGRIIHIGSVHSLIASPYKSAYVAAKHALLGFSKAVALGDGGRGHHQQHDLPGVHPHAAGGRADQGSGTIASDFGGRGDPTGSCWSRCRRRRSSPIEEVAAAVEFLIGPMARNITGQTITIDGGWTAR